MYLASSFPRMILGKGAGMMTVRLFWRVVLVPFLDCAFIWPGGGIPLLDASHSRVCRELGVEHKSLEEMYIATLSSHYLFWF